MLRKIFHNIKSVCTSLFSTEPRMRKPRDAVPRHEKGDPNWRDNRYTYENDLALAKEAARITAKGRQDEESSEDEA